MKIAIAGTGYFGQCIAVLLAQQDEVVAWDINAPKCEHINRWKFTAHETELHGRPV